MRSAALSGVDPAGVAVIAYEVAERLPRRLGDPPEDLEIGRRRPALHRDTVMGSTETSAARFFCFTTRSAYRIRSPATVLGGMS